MKDATSKSDRTLGARSIWTKPERGRRGPAPGLGRDDIVTAAIALADADGLSAVSMRAIATALHTGAGALYRYVTSRDDILDLMTDHVIGDLRPYPEPTDDWLGDLLRLGHRQLALFRRHPWLLDVPSRTSGMGPQTLGWFDHCLRVLRPVHRTPAAKFEAIAMLIGLTTLFARTAAAPHALTAAGLDLTDHPDLADALSRLPTSPRPDLYERTLSSVLTGLIAGECSEQS